MTAAISRSDLATKPPLGGTPTSDRILAGGPGPTVAEGQTLFITDLVFSNPSETATGELQLTRGGKALMVLRLENFRDLDFHFVTPISVHAGETLTLVATCTPPTAPAPPPDCTPAVFYSGYVEGE